MLRIEAKPQEQMSRHATDTFPDECCGFMYGAEAPDGTRTVTEVTAVNNAKEGDKRKRFEISARDYMKAENHALAGGLVLLGVYHSHPNHPAIASETDRLSAQPWFSYLILSVQDGKADHQRSWRLNEERRFDEEPVSNEYFIKQT